MAKFDFALLNDGMCIRMLCGRVFLAIKNPENATAGNNAILQKRQVIHHVNHGIEEIGSVSGERIHQAGLDIAMHGNQAKCPQNRNQR